MRGGDTIAHVPFNASYMQRIFLILFIAWGYTLSHAQFVETFENLQCPFPPRTSTFSHAFQKGCVPSWSASHGTPRIVEYNGMFAGIREYEGIFINTPIEKEIPYTIKLRVRAGDGGGEPDQFTIYVVGANGMVNSEGSFPSPVDRQVLATIQTNNWQEIEEVVSYNLIASRNFSNLWFYFEASTLGNNYGLLIKQISLTKNCPSQSNAFYQNVTLTGTLQKQAVIITMGENITSSIPSGKVVFQPMGSQSFAAEKYIEVSNGVEIAENNNVEFKTYLSGLNCIVSPPNTCLNGIKDANETYIDCGGVCPSACQFRLEEAGTTNAIPTTTLGFFPNPCNGRLEYRLAPSEGNFTIEILDCLGITKLVMHTVATSGTIQLQDLPNGSYLAKVTDSLGNTQHQRIEIQH